MQQKIGSFVLNLFYLTALQRNKILSETGVLKNVKIFCV